MTTTEHIAKPQPTYRGEQSYVFVSYSHEDTAGVYPEIAWLQAQGVHVWYDEGITPGEEWSEELGNAIDGADTFLFFVTPQAVRSKHCRNEVHFAQNRGKRVLAVHLQTTTLPAGLELTLGASQAILAYADDLDRYRERLLDTLGGSKVETTASAPGAEQETTAPDSGTAAALGITQEMIEETVEQILADKEFNQAPRLRELLQHIVTHTISGAHGELKEYAIGVEVFGRGANFDPRKDTIVRVQARRLRGRLQRYYDERGREDPLRIDIPKGHYRATFTSRALEESASTEVSGSNTKRWAWTAALGIAALGAVALLIGQFGQAPTNRSVANTTVAVLPFSDLSPNQDRSYLAYGLADNLRDTLGSAGGLTVLGRESSAVAFRESGANPETANKLGASVMVEGQLRLDGADLQIKVHLVDTSSRERIATLDLQRDSSDLLQVQQEMATFVTQQLNPQASPPPLQAITLAARDVSASDLILLARHYEMQVRDRSIPDQALLARATTLYRDATLLEPDSALAHSRLAGALLYQGAIEEAKQPIFQALALNPDISEVQETFGRYLFLSRLPGSGDAWRRAIELNPNNPDALSSYAYWTWMKNLGEYKEEERLWRRALALDPLSLSRHADLGNFFGMMGWREETLGMAERVVNTFDSVPAYQTAARLFELAGEVDVAIAWALAAFQLEPDNQEVAWQLAELLAIIGLFDTAAYFEPEPGIGLMFLSRDYPGLIDQAEFLLLEQPSYLDVKYKLGFAYNAVGRYEDAIDVLEDARVVETLASDSKQADATEALASLVDALRMAGDTEEATRLALSEELAGTKATEPSKWRDWWYAWVTSCGFSVAGYEERAIKSIVRIERSPRLIWMPYLLDAPCMQNLAERPEFQAIVTSVQARRSELRQRLPDTLLRFGLTLPST